jgi:hypothetical protein
MSNFSIIPSADKLLELISAAFQKIVQWRRTRLTTHLIEDFRHNDLEHAFDLYTQRIPADERFEPTDIIRWLRQSQQQAKDRTNASGDYFLTAKSGRRVCGFILFHYYYKERLAFFAYFAVAKGKHLSDGHDLAARSLMAQANRLFSKRRELMNCEGFVLEVDDPRRAESKKVATERLARIRRFCMLAEAQGFTLRAFDIDYKQPRLNHINDNSSEKTMLLMYARNGSQLSKSSVALREVRKLLKFIYLTVYPESYSEIDEENKVYRLYLKNLYSQEAEALSQPVQTLNFKQLKAKVAAKFSGLSRTD